jgi:hypothetical protein
MTALRGYSLSDPLALIAFGRLRESSWYWEGRQLVVRLEPGTTVEQFASAVCSQIELLALERVDCMNRIVAAIRHRVLNISGWEIRDQLEQVFAQMDRDSPLLTAWHSPVQLLMLPMPYNSKPDTVNVVYRDGVSVPDTDSWCVDSDSDVLACDTNVLRMPFPRYPSKHAAVTIAHACFCRMPIAPFDMHTALTVDIPSSALASLMFLSNQSMKATLDLFCRAEFLGTDRQVADAVYADCVATLRSTRSQFSFVSNPALNPQDKIAVKEVFIRTQGDAGTDRRLH